MKKTILAISMLTALVACKKEKVEEPITPNNSSAPTSNVTIRTVNDTVDFSKPNADKSTYDFSKSLGFIALDSNTANTGDDYHLLSLDSNSALSFDDHKRKLEFFAGNNHYLLVNSDGNIIKFNEGDEINSDDFSGKWFSSFGIGARVLEDGKSTNFELNQTAYIGLIYVFGTVPNQEEYHGWVKIKTLNNHHSCIVESYGVSDTPNEPVKAGM